MAHCYLNLWPTKHIFKYSLLNLWPYGIRYENLHVLTALFCQSLLQPASSLKTGFPKGYIFSPILPLARSLYLIMIPKALHISSEAFLHILEVNLK
jgi:hypothetical protein